MKGLCQSQSSVCHAPRLAGHNSRLRHEAEVCFPACLWYPSTLYLSGDWRRDWGFQLFGCVGPARSTKIEAFRDKMKKNTMSKCSVYWNFTSQKCTSKLKLGNDLCLCLCPNSQNFLNWKLTFFPKIFWGLRLNLAQHSVSRNIWIAKKLTGRSTTPFVI